MNLVFCYGTLRYGESNHEVIQGAVLKERNSWTKGMLYDTGNGYPALIKSVEEEVYGELYEVNEQLLERIDILEGFQEGRDHNLYDRIVQRIESENGNYEAITYVMREAEDHFIKIEGGDWVLYQNKSSYLF
ncbi:gamma-glutamylcyclotransferase family protein [Alkalihalobacillus macyae]|uniref:gamma-glutamylcyclotransferase family protein n=1 Tax=Guptibacillus hwajinpoensis TaxID=208199 RepID=UPI00273CEBB0|nr:gamma-glutamylcyclotransferase family protein [Alkalihalobacillus macyae]MDP4549307.1 gamma-glutamylcyclotransferase family protein [Alkalihalobacillus macyae]